MIALPARPLLAAADSPVEVELRCKIEPAPGMQDRRPLTVTLKKSTGKLVRHDLKVSGETVRYKRLEPGIYIVCLQGAMGIPICRSFDLIPPPNKKRHTFIRKIPAPPMTAHSVDAQLVNWVRLATPKDARVELRMSEEAHLQGDDEQEVNHLRRALDIYPRYVEAWNNLAAHHIIKGDYHSAIDCLRRCTSLDPDFFPGWVNLGNSLLATAEFEEGLETCQRALKLRPNDPLAVHLVGTAYYYLRRYSEAAKYFKKHMAMDPESANAS